MPLVITPCVRVSSAPAHTPAGKDANEFALYAHWSLATIKSQAIFSISQLIPWVIWICCCRVSGAFCQRLPVVCLSRKLREVLSLLPWALGLASEAHQLTICWRWLTLVNIGKAASEYALFSLGARWEPIRVSAPIDAPTLLSIEKVKKELC